MSQRNISTDSINLRFVKLLVREQSNITSAVDKIWNMEHPGTFQTIPERDDNYHSYEKNM